MDKNRVLTNRAYLKQQTDNDPSARARVLAMSQADIVYWVQNFCWCFEPRSESEFPIVLFDYQGWALRQWVEDLNANKDDIIIEKARDMGITWMILYLFVWFWLFRSNSNFLISSFREQEVDWQGSMATLFPKIRFIIEKLPEWMKPEGYNAKLHATYMRIYNPVNKSFIVGSAPVPNFGRSGRYKAILLDELAQWPYSESSWNACSQSTKIRIALATPWGKDNVYARLALDPNNVRVEYPGDKTNV